jgi:hypothetical protein
VLLSACCTASSACDSVPRGGCPALQPEIIIPPQSSGTAIHGRRLTFLLAIAFPPTASLDPATQFLTVPYLSTRYYNNHVTQLLLPVVQEALIKRSCLMLIK